MKSQKMTSPRAKKTFSRLRDFALSHLDRVWKVGDLCLRIMGTNDPESQRKLKSYMSKLRSFLLGEPKQLLLAIRVDGVVQSYRIATPGDAELNRKMGKSYTRRALNSVVRAHNVLDVFHHRELLPAAEIEGMRRFLPAPSQMRLPF
jgi:hypothetical protein